ncbi:MAG: ATP-dependent helicase, partial [Chloroflexi bacterium]|nr:ATP-dependent helicase [Chloroflexota bacterium]
YSDPLGLQGDFSVLDEHETALVVSEVIEDLDLTLEIGELKKALTHYRAKDLWPEDLNLSDSQRREALESFDALLGFYNTIDMEGIVRKACEILSRSTNDLPPVHLQVDEYQDLNPIDQQLVRLASGDESSEVVVVGDDAQSIYGFRHANPAGIRELWASDEWEHMSLDVSHRLPSHILRAARALVKDRGYLGASVDMPPDDGKHLMTLCCTTSGLQAKAIAKLIRDRLGKPKQSSEEVFIYKDFMVLCPNGAQVGQLAEALLEMGIPVKTVRKQAMPESVWMFVLLLRMLSNRDGLALRQWLDCLGLERNEIRGLRKQAQNQDRPLFDWCETNGDASVREVLAAIERLHACELDPAQFRDALAAVPGLVRDDDLWNVVDDSLSELPLYGRIIGHIRQAYGILDQDLGDEEADAGEDGVLVATMHSSKGLEAEVVFIAWMNKKFMPARGRDVLEEERVFYVTLTRAKQDVILLFFEEYDQKKKRRLQAEAMSPFLRAIVNHLDIRRVMAKDLR